MHPTSLKMQNITRELIGHFSSTQTAATTKWFIERTALHGFSDSVFYFFLVFLSKINWSSVLVVCVQSSQSLQKLSTPPARKTARSEKIVKCWSVQLRFSPEYLLSNVLICRQEIASIPNISSLFLRALFRFSKKLN